MRPRQHDLVADRRAEWIDFSSLLQCLHHWKRTSRNPPKAAIQQLEP